MHDLFWNLLGNEGFPKRFLRSDFIEISREFKTIRELVAYHTTTYLYLIGWTPFHFTFRDFSSIHNRDLLFTNWQDVLLQDRVKPRSREIQV